MSSRRRSREFVLQALYQVDVDGGNVREALNGLWAGLIEDPEGVLSNRAADSEEIEFATQLAIGVERNRDALDRKIEECSTNWRVSRMALVDRNILRLATWELQSHPEIPATVTLNEAIELAKRFGNKDSKSFVNGILDRIARDSGRLDK